MAQNLNAAAFQRKIREQERKIQAEINRINRENKRRIDAHNRQVAQRNAQITQNNQRQIDAYNRDVRKVNEHNRKVNQRNQETITELNRRLRQSNSDKPRYTQQEQALADQIQQRVALYPEREYDVFLSYARIDGSEIGQQLRVELEQFGVRVWFDALAIVPGQSQALQMDKGLRRSRTGIALLTPAYLTGRFWTERELGVLLGKKTLIPVLHQVSFSDVAEYSSFLPDLAGFETERDSVEVIAEKIAAAILSPQSNID